MREILLGGKRFKLAPGTDIIQRPINPFRGKLGLSGSGLEYSDFSQASLEEYSDFRNGLGLLNELPAESARLWWTEGIDFTTPRSAVLGPRILTADYLPWNDLIAYTLLNFFKPTTANGYCYECTTAGTSGATEPTWPTTLGSTVTDGTVVWTCRAYLATVKIIDFQNSTYVIQNSRILKFDSGFETLLGVNTGLASPLDAIVVKDATDEYLIVTSATAALYTVDGTTWNTLTGPRGYLAWYDKKLRSIDTDGGVLRSSPADDIDGTWTTFNLTGQLGTVYDLFEGKLLADGTPALYFCGTHGLFTIDVTNEKAYKQEIAYPPITNAGNVGFYWQANVWVATGHGILKVTPNMATLVGPNQDDGLPSGYQGKIYDMIGVNNWLVYCVNGAASDKSSILKRNSAYGGNLQVYTTSAVNKPIACLYHSPSSLYTNGRLWWGEDTSVKYMMFPDITSNVKQISTYQYGSTSGYGKFPIFRKLAALSKVALGVAAITKACDDNEYIGVFYGLNGADPTTSLGTFKTSPKPTTLTFASGLGLEFYTIQFAIILYHGTGSSVLLSPALESLLFYYLPAPAIISGFSFRIQATEDNAGEIITNMETIRDTKTLVLFYPSGDAAKTSYKVKLITMPLRFYHEEQRTREGYVEADVQEIFNG